MKARLKQPLALVLALFMAFSLLCGSAWAVEVLPVEESPQTMGVIKSRKLGSLTCELDDTGILTISGNGKIEMDDDAYAEGFPWRYEDWNFDKVVIKDGVTGIGRDAFGYWYDHDSQFCYTIKSVTIPDSVTTIEANAFTGCTALTSIVIPDSVTSIGDNAFKGCTSLASVTLSDPEPTLGKDSFANTPWWNNRRPQSGTCGENLNWVLDENGTLTISGSGAMKNYTDNGDRPWEKLRKDIKKVEVKSGVTHIGNFAFFWLPDLTDVSISDTVISIGRDAFDSCTGLTTISIPDSVTDIDIYAFYYCNNLKEAKIPSNITEIPEGMFCDCHTLSEFTIPESVTKVGSSAFYNCMALTSMKLNDNITSIEGSAFRGCESLSDLQLGKNITNIGYSAIYGCKSLTELTLPKQVSNIEDYAFGKCDNLEKVVFTGDAPTFGSNVFENVKATVRYPTDNKSWAKKAGLDYGGSLTWVAWPEQQTITAKNFTKTLGDAAFKLGAKTSGDGALTYSSSNTKVAAVNGSGKVTLKGVGKATITITAAATDNYQKAAKKVTVTVKKPTVKTPTLSKLTNSKSKTMTVTWKKVADATGYEVQYTTDKKFKKSVKTVKVKSPKTVSTTIKKLTKKKKYYVQVRAYKTVLKTNYYSKWSGAKNLTIKK
jgi:hypothetical protein